MVVVVGWGCLTGFASVVVSLANELARALCTSYIREYWTRDHDPTLLDDCYRHLCSVVVCVEGMSVPDLGTALHVQMWQWACFRYPLLPAAVLCSRASLAD